MAVTLIFVVCSNVHWIGSLPIIQTHLRGMTVSTQGALLRFVCFTNLTILLMTCL